MSGSCNPTKYGYGRPSLRFFCGTVAIFSGHGGKIYDETCEKSVFGHGKFVKTY
jgi:hypothetical protein